MQNLSRHIMDDYGKLLAQTCQNPDNLILIVMKTF